MRGSEVQVFSPAPFPIPPHHLKTEDLLIRDNEPDYRALGHRTVTSSAEDKLTKKIKQQMAVVFLLALEAAVRQGEIFGLTWKNVFILFRPFLIVIALMKRIIGSISQ